MWNCNGDCHKCGKCTNIFPGKILKEIKLPEDFKNDSKKGEFGVAVDIGTTTIAIALWSLEDGKLLGQKGATNPQRQFGADVISRISFAQGSHENIFAMQHPLRMTIRSLIIELCHEHNIDLHHIKKTAFCGNTTMMLIFAGMSIDGIAKYPFTPEHIAGMVINSKFDNVNIDGYMLPNIGGHIGSDITAGILSTRLDTFYGNGILVDIGTNGEIVLKIKDKLYAFSTAAGPAFEGANMKFGMSATKGAIESFKFTNDTIYFKTVGSSNNKECDERVNIDENGKFIEPKGICGSGIMSAIDEMLKMHILNREGKLSDYDTFVRQNPYSSLKDRFVQGGFVLAYREKAEPIVITQQDIREFQLAKAAIKSGITLLLKETESTIEDIDKIFLAGGFGINTSIDILLNLGILPKVDCNKVESVGNSALAGTSMALMSEKEKVQATTISKEVVRIDLNLNDDFQNEYMNALSF